MNKAATQQTPVGPCQIRHHMGIPILPSLLNIVTITDVTCESATLILCENCITASSHIVNLNEAPRLNDCHDARPSADRVRVHHDWKAEKTCVRMRRRSWVHIAFQPVLGQAPPSLPLLLRFRDVQRLGGPSHVFVALIQNPERNEDPEHIEESQIKPHVHNIRGVEIRTASQPFRTERHETAVEFSGREDDHPEPTVISLFPETVADPGSRWCADEDCQQF